MTHYSNTNNPIDFPKKKDIPLLERMAAQSLVEYDGELIFSKERFAELIVKKCSNFLKDALDDHFAAEQLEKHFGVEE